MKRADEGRQAQMTEVVIVVKGGMVQDVYPEHFRFLFSSEDQVFGIEPCEMDDGGAHRLPEIVKRDHYDIKSKDLVRFVFQSCGWAKKLTYRVPGVRKAPDSHTVYFDLQQALEVHEGRTRVAQQ